MNPTEISNMLWLVASQMGVHALVWVLAARLLPEERRALLHWAYFMASLSLGLALAGARDDSARSWWHFNAVNVITCVGFAVMRIGTERFMGLAYRPLAHWGLVAPGLLGLLLLPPDLTWAPLRVFAAYGTQALVLAVLLARVVPAIGREFGPGNRRAILWPGALIVGVMAAMALTQLVHWGQGLEMHQASSLTLGLMYTYLLGSAAFNFAFMALVLQRLTKRLREQAVRDPLTGLLNRRAMDAALERQWARHQRARTPLSVLMVDIDHFKQVNDRIGHAGGDAVLRRLAQLLQHERRNDDAVGRVGGEEFLLLLPGVPAAMAFELAERLRELVLQAQIGATVSVGVAQSGGREDDSDSLLRRADGALYQAKQNGRNRVELAR